MAPLRLLVVALLGSLPLRGQAAPGVADPLQFARLRDFSSHRSSSNHPDWNSNDDSKRPIPGETVTLADLTGPGVVTHLWITVADNEYGWPRLLRLRIWYDGSAEPSVDAPLGDFFGVGHGVEKPVKSQMVRNSSAGRARNCYWPMPFRKSCRIAITNEGRRRVANLYYHVDWEQHRELPADTAYFHARYRQELPASGGKDYEFLNVQGRGFYVGTVLSVVQAEAGWFGEGDDFFWVDGASRPSIEGTGSEDYFNDAWSLRVDDGPYYGVPVAEGTGLGSRMGAFRWHVVDPIPFRKALRFTMEHKGWTFQPDGAVKSAFGERTDLMSSVAFWYQEGVAQGQPAVPYGSARLPHGNAQQLEVEQRIAEARAERGKAEVVKDLFWSKDVIVFAGEGPGAALTVPFDVAADGDYELYVQFAQGADYGIYSVLLDGKAAVAPTLEHEPGADVRPVAAFDGFAAETYVGADFQVGWPRLGKGTHTLTFTCTGRNPAATGHVLGVDTIILARVGAAGWALAAQAQEPRLPSLEIAELGKTLAGHPDPVVRGMAAMALRDAGRRSRPALIPLAVALKDTDPNVRIMSALAIAALGGDAAEAVPALIDACQVQGEQVHVQRALAQALGAIGKPAAAAATVLRELARVPRVRWAAEAAIQQIQ